MDTKSILLLQDWQNGDETWKAGQALQVDVATADRLIAEKAAELYDPDREKREAAETAKQKADEEVRIADAVKRALTDQLQTIGTTTRPLPVVTHVSDRRNDDPKAGFSKGIAEFLKAVHVADASYTVDPRLLSLKAPTGMGEASDSTGGYLVPSEFRAELLKRTYDQALVASRCRRIPIAGNSVQIPYIAESSRADGSRAGGVRGYWVDEAGTYTASSTKIGRLELKAKKVTALVYATDEMLTDSVITLGEIINTQASEELAFQIDDAIINGTGAGKPLGLLNAPCTVSVSKETSQQATTLMSENILKMWARLWSRSRGNSVWFVNQDLSPQLYQLSLAIGTGGAVTYLPPGGLSGNPFATLMGRPIVEIEQCATLGTVGDIILADMSQYLLGEHVSGMQTATSIHVRFLNGEQIFRFTLRVDGQPWWAAALTPYKGTSNTVSPFITLATRS